MIILHIHNIRIELHTFLSIKGSRDALINMKNVSYIPITTSPQCKIESYLMEMKFDISNINNYVSCQLSCHIPDKNMVVHVNFKWNKQIKKEQKITRKIHWTHKQKYGMQIIVFKILLHAQWKDHKISFLLVLLK